MNGSVELVRTVVARDIRTVNGDIELLDASVVKGDVVIEDKFVRNGGTGRIDIEVAGGSVIEGDVVVKRDVKVRVILSDGGKVLGTVEGAEVIDNNTAQQASDGA
ncbi:MAG: hypothetical protein GTO30_05510 [Acidobacteria bacterium]|nr:hypothetical protein [Acidobacteriota bacterium]NIQ86819.1 hypothetical protein [Acidobacteriota bacterium]